MNNPPPWLKADQTTDPTAPTGIRRLGRNLLHNGLIFDFGAWAYAWMTGNPTWQANSARLLDTVVGQTEGVQVLDLGAGPGNSALAMGQNRPQASFIAFDLAQQMLETAAHNRVRAGWSAQRLALVRGDALRLPFANASVDVVTGHSFLYLLPDYQGVLGEAQRVLRPGGQIAFLEPHAGLADWQWLSRQDSLPLLVSISLWRVYSWLHRRFSPARLHADLTTAGFEQIETEVTLGGFGIFGRARKPSQKE
ncbi:MAG: methyltransferase domain-containing protein [Chloroflexota bacterium]|nr:methyltransferase domain-containing protein [Chloroflexota bacterium]